MTGREKLMKIISEMDNETFVEVMTDGLLCACDICPFVKKCDELMEIHNEEVQEHGGNGIVCNDVILKLLDEEVEE